MSDSYIVSPKRLTRRSILKLPFLCWLQAYCMRFAFAKTPLWGRVEAAAKVTPVSPARRSTSLNGAWTLTYGNCPNCGQSQEATSPPADWVTIPATVPGNVEMDLVAAGGMEPLEKGNRVYQALDIESYQWWYRRTFSVEAAEPDEKAELVFDGLDCLGTVWLNGKLVGRSANMLIGHRFDITSLLLPNQANEVVVRIDPVGDLDPLMVRKPPHVFGWDIMPRIVSAGLWRDVRVEWSRPVQLSSLYWSTQSVEVERNTAQVAVQWEISGTAEHRGQYKVEVKLERNGRTALNAKIPAPRPSGQQTFTMNAVDLWWPRGYGEPSLYEATVSLLDHRGVVLDRQTARVGIRTVELRRSDEVTPEKPGEFGFVVNGVPIFVKGANWSALDALHSRDAEHLPAVFPMLAELNCNMVRCWGGNVYASDRFLDLCDETGLLVWQDFAMACAAYPQDDAFAASIGTEAEAVVTRMRNHPSLAVWCGNNECDDSIAERQTPEATITDPNDDRLSRQVLPAIVKRLDPDRAYLPSSPYHSPAVVAAGNNMQRMPEVHLWGPRGYFKTPFYTDEPAHFVSEIGYHGCPARSSLERMFDPEFLQPWVQDHQWNDEWLTKSVRFRPDSTTTVGRNDLMIKQVRAFFGTVPEKLDDFIAASQMCQAEALKFFVELWRQQKGPKQGILWWNLRDGWPILSDSVVDYYNTKKLAFRYIQRVQRDVQVICCENVGGQHSIVVVNDTLQPVTGGMKLWRTGDNKNLLERSFTVERNGKAVIGTLPHPAQSEMWQFEWTTEGTASHASHYVATSTTINLEQYQQWMRSTSLV
ncbi:MAG: glycoside hydrolase family 2 protein [Acidobacteriaceae bacterium]